MSDDLATPRASIGYHSATGLRPRNEDFVGAVLGSGPPRGTAGRGGGHRRRHRQRQGRARGGGNRGARLPRRVLGRAGDHGGAAGRRPHPRFAQRLDQYAQGRQDANLVGMGCTFTALVLRGRLAHLLHVGDTRAYRLSDDRLVRLTTDHVRDDRGKSPVLTRALGIEPELRLDYTSHPVALHDRFLLCTDGVHGALVDEAIADILRVRSAPEDTSRALVEAALEAGSTDNCTALVLDVVALPTARSADVGSAIMRLKLIPTPQVGDTVDGFVLNVLVSDGRYSRLFGAIDEVDGGTVVLKFPKPQVAAVATFHAAFVREAWVGTRVTQPLGRACDRVAAGAADLPLHRHAAVHRGAAGDPAVPRAARGPGGGPHHRDPACARGWRRCTAPASSTATSSRTT